MQEVLVSKIFNYASTPTKNVEGQFWFNPSTNVLSRYNGTVWKPITVSSDDVAVLTDGSKVSLTSYLNTQIAALAEGIDSKQDKLETYKEKQGDSRINTTISSSVGEDDGNGAFTGNIIIHTKGNDDAGGAPHSGDITISTGNSWGAGGNITLTAGDSDGAAGASLAVNGGSSNGHITLSAGHSGNITLNAGEGAAGNPAHNNIILEAASGNLELNVAKITGSAVDTTIRSSSTDSHIPTSKAVYGALTLKQDKLLLYSETIDPAAEKSATISAANINLIGSVAEGNAIASGNRSHAEGYSTMASGDYSHAEGHRTTASGNHSHTEGYSTMASGDYSHAEGYSTKASGASSHAEGCCTIASNFYQHVQGKFSIEDADNKYADIIGNGSTIDKRSNAQTVSWDGISWSQSDVRAGGTDQDSAAHSLAAKQNATDNSLTTTAKTIVGAINELKTATDAMVVVSTDNTINIAPTTAQTGILIASSKTNGGNVIITPKITNTGACYLSTSSTYSNLNPIYPDPTNNKYTYPNLGTVYLFVDNAGDSADIVIENFAG